MAYNFLRLAKNIKNSQLCRYDSNIGYTSDFSINGNVNGWDIYNNVYMYGCWAGILFGSTYEKECYIERTESFVAINAEEYCYIEIMLQVVDENTDRVVSGLNKAKVMWKRTTDTSWADDRSSEFILTSKGKWAFYKLNMGPYKYWQGDISSVRLYPFIDGHKGDKFFIKYIRVVSETVYKCTNNDCSFYPNFEHPCKGVGAAAYVEANFPKTHYTTVSGVDSILLINIDGYGDEIVDLGTHTNLDGKEMARVVGSNIGKLNIGGYSFNTTEYTEFNTIKISSGTKAYDSSVTVLYSKCSEELGFYNSLEEPTFTLSSADTPATGFDYTSTKLLQSHEINSLIDGNNSIAYTHNTKQYSVEGGRQDFNEIASSQLISQLVDTDGTIQFSSLGRTTVDLSNRVDNNGRLKHFWVFGKAYENASFKVLRPRSDGSFKVVYTKVLPQVQDGLLYTTDQVVLQTDCNVLVNKGDLLGVYNVDLYVGHSITRLPNATFTQYDGDITDIVPKEKVYSFGVGGFSLYARGDLRQTETVLDIDLGTRVNVAEFLIKGKERVDKFEFNLASCLDISWTVDLFGESHEHRGCTANCLYSWVHQHQNKYYGKECLNDSIVTADNGQVGNSYSNDSDGLNTYGPHSYFYVNGDAEWLYSKNGISEYHYPMAPDGLTYYYTTDPVALTLYFPGDATFKVHKNIIYFKEKNNFRDFSLSFFKGNYYFGGDAEDAKFRYVPKYQKIWVDGALYLEGDDARIDTYLFNNPTHSSITDYSDDEQKQAKLSSLFVDWTTLGHEFDRYECRGFRIYCDYHNSTKITEIETYAYIDNDVTMTDNAILSFSDYGDIWRTVGFQDYGDDTVGAFLGATPRYLRLKLESHLQFDVNEIAITVTEQLNTSSTETILLSNAKQNDISPGKEIKIVNNYDKPFDLSVDLPNDLGLDDNIVFWNRLDSKESLESSGLGPTPILYKSKSFELSLNSGQCAINSLSYGLKNLVLNKNLFYNNNSFDWLPLTWDNTNSFVDFGNESYIYTNNFSYTFDPTSSKYWRFEAISANDVLKINSIVCFHGDTRVVIRRIITQYTGLDGNNYILDNGSDIRSTLNYETFFNNGNTSDWIFSGVSSTVPMPDHLKLVTSSSSNFLMTSPFFSNTQDFETIFEFECVSEDSFTNSYVDISFEFYNGNVREFYLRHTYLTTQATPNKGAEDCNDTTLNHKIYIYVDDTQQFLAGYSGDFLCINKKHELTVRKSGKRLSFFIDSNKITTVEIQNVSINKFKVNSAASVEPINVTGFNLFSFNTYNTILISQESSVGIELTTNTPVDSVFIVASGDVLELDISTSYDNSSYQQLTSSVVSSSSEHVVSLAVPLGKRHSLAIIRNYGEGNLYDISVSNNTSFSNSLDPIDQVEFTSSKDDCSYVKIDVPCTDGTLRFIRKLGIYPNISNALCIGGGYNNEWDSLGNKLTEYPVIKNVALLATVSGVNYKSYAPSNAVNGDTESMDFQNNCWGYTDAETPELYIEFESSKYITSFKLYSGYSDTVDTPLNNSFTLSLDNTVSGTSRNYEEAITVASVSSNNPVLYKITPMYATRAKLTINSFSPVDVPDTTDNVYRLVSIGLLREIEIFSEEYTHDISSEDYPIVCFNLREKFDIVDHALTNKYQQPEHNTSPSNLLNNEWDNSDEFFAYSDTAFEQPEKVSFLNNNQTVIEYQSTEVADELLGYIEYVFDTSVFLPKGNHHVDWEAYYPEHVGEISLIISGSEFVEIFAYNYGSGWVTQPADFFLISDGYFTIKIKQHISDTYTWGAKNIVIYRSYGLTKWVAVTRDTATGYSYDFDENKQSPDYLGKVMLYGSGTYNIAEYYWWWHTDLSNLSNDVVNTLEGKKSLVLEYPASSNVEILSFTQGDTFGIDTLWSINDLFSFNLWIDDVNNIDSSFGYIIFGASNLIASDYYYIWNIENIDLHTGWNNIELSFMEASTMYPANSGIGGQFLHSNLNIKKSSTDLSTLYISFRGTGNTLKLLFDNFKISRNTFNTDVKFSKGLCLTANDHLMMPLSNVALSKGSIEFWLKFGVDTIGRDMFGELNSATLFTLSNNNNDIISIRIKPANWFEIFVGNIRKQVTYTIGSTVPAGVFLDIGNVRHIALVWSNDGLNTDNGDTFRFYINNTLIMSSKETWTVDDTKLAYFKLGGGISQSSDVYDSYSDFIYENIKVYNYCKSDFKINQRNIDGDVVYSPENFLELSKDDIEYVGVASTKLPFVFEQVPPGQAVSLYIRSNKDRNFSSNNSTAKIIIDWLTTV